MNDLPAENTLISEKQTPVNSALGLENISITDGEASSASKIEFSYSTPKKISDLSPFLNKWSPKIHDVVSIIEEVINTSNDNNDDEDDVTSDTNRSDEVTVNDNVVYIDEDAVKQEEFVDENSEEAFDSDATKNSKKADEELSISFDENKVKQEFNITSNLCIKLDKITNFNSKSFIDSYDSSSKRATRSDALRENRSLTFPTKKNESSFKSYPKKSSKNQKSSRSDSRSGGTPTIEETKQTNHQKKKQPCNLNNQKNKRQSLRLSGKSPEIKLVDELPYTTRSGKKRVYEEPKSKAVNGHLSRSCSTKDPNSTNLFGGNLKKEPENEVKTRIRSSSPSTFKKHIDFMYVCQCCDQKYLLLEQIKAHVRTHFPNIATN